MIRPWMPLYIADYRVKTSHLGAIQHGAYLLLIMHYWTYGGLPEDDGSLARIACMTAAEWRKHRPAIAAFFHDGWKHSRIDEELAKATEISSKRSAAAGQRHSKSSANAEQMQSNCNANAEQLHTHARASSQSQSKKPKRASCIRRHALPDDFALNEADIACAREAGWNDSKASSELIRFRNHAHANGRLQVDWHAAWRNWVNSPFQQTGPPRVNGHAVAAPRPGSREDRAERTANALAQLRRQAGFDTDEPGRGGPACDDLAGFLPFAKPAGS